MREEMCSDGASWGSRWGLLINMEMAAFSGKQELRLSTPMT